jgi:hypothetical protein
MTSHGSSAERQATISSFSTKLATDIDIFGLPVGRTGAIPRIPYRPTPWLISRAKEWREIFVVSRQLVPTVKYDWLIQLAQTRKL